MKSGLLIGNTFLILKATNARNWFEADVMVLCRLRLRKIARSYAKKQVSKGY